MGYLNKSTITVDAVLTKKGRELLAKGRQGFKISQFAISDDEVDYELYDTAHPLGTAYYGSVIENMPLLEASTDETQALRFKLVTLPRGTKEIPIISIGYTSVSLTFGVSSAIQIVPSTAQGYNGPGFGYTAILYDSSAATLTGTGLSTSPTTPTFIGEGVTNNALVARGIQFTLAPRDVSSQTETQLTIIGNQTGASVTIPITIKPQPVATIG